MPETIDYATLTREEIVHRVNELYIDAVSLSFEIKDLRESIVELCRLLKEAEE